VSDLQLAELDDEPGGTRGLSPKSLLKIGLEVLLIGLGVFLGLMGEQWRERAQHRELAETSLRRFRTELTASRESVVRVKDYHAAKTQLLDAYLAADAGTRKASPVALEGLQPAFFEHTAWDLALATQSLVYLDPPLAFSISRIYTVQQEYADLSRAILQALYLRTPSENLPGFLSAVRIYYGDIVLIEPKLLEMYDQVLPQIDHALGEPPAQKKVVENAR
jgi:hypothetical protein